MNKINENYIYNNNYFVEPLIRILKYESQVEISEDGTVWKTTLKIFALPDLCKALTPILKESKVDKISNFSVEGSIVVFGNLAEVLGDKIDLHLLKEQIKKYQLITN